MTGTKHTSMLYEATFVGLSRWGVDLKSGERAWCQTAQPGTLFTEDGLDCHTGQPPHPAYARLLSLPLGTVYHETKRTYRPPQDMEAMDGVDPVKSVEIDF